MENDLIAESTTIIGELETSLGVPTVVFVANWTGEYSVDADEKAGRLVADAIVDRLRAEGGDRIALVIAARGGYPAFADAVLRTTRQLDVKLEALVPCRIDGAAGTVAAAADAATLHPGAGIGALDVGLCVAPRRPMNAALFAHCPVDPVRFAELDPADQSDLARLAFDRFIRDEQRRMAGYLLGADLQQETVDWLLDARLGAGMTTGVDRLNEIGVDARVAPDPLAEQLEELIDWARGALHLFETPDDRFRVSEDIETEVEFEPATLVPAAAILSGDMVWLHQLDTGSPDPDAPRLFGRWTFWNPTENQEE